MAHEISVTLRADPAPYEAAVGRLAKATDEWSLSTAAGADDVADRFADVIRALVDMGREGGRSRADIDKMLRGIGLSAPEAEEALSAIDRELQQIGDHADDADDAGTAVGKISDKADEVGDSLRGLGDIAKDVLSGDMAGAAESAAGVLSGLASFVLPGIAGAAAGAAGALGVGALVAAFDEVRARQERINETGSDWAEGIITGARDAESVIGKFAIRQGELTSNYTEVKKYADAWGVDVVTAAGALGGVDEDITAASTSFDALTSAMRAQNDEAVKSAGSAAGAAGMYMALNAQTEEGRAKIEEIIAAQAIRDEQLTASAALQAAYAAELYALAQASGTATGETDALGNAIVALPDGKQVVIDAETQTAYTDLDALEKKAIPEKTATAKADTSAADKKFKELEELRLNDKVGKVDLNVDKSAWNDWRPGSKTVWVDVKLKGPGAAALLGGG